MNAYQIVSPGVVLQAGARPLVSALPVRRRSERARLRRSPAISGLRSGCEDQLMAKDTTDDPSAALRAGRRNDGPALARREDPDADLPQEMIALAAERLMEL